MAPNDPLRIGPRLLVQPRCVPRLWLERDDQPPEADPIAQESSVLAAIRADVEDALDVEPAEELVQVANEGMALEVTAECDLVAEASDELPDASLEGCLHRFTERTMQVHDRCRSG